MTRSSILLLLGLVGCGRPDPFSSSISKIVFEVDYATGADPYTGNVPGAGDSWQLFQSNVSRLFAGRGKTFEIPSQPGQMEALPTVTDTDFTADRLLAIAERHRGRVSKDETLAYYILFVNGYYNKDGRRDPSVLGVTLNDSGVIAMFKPVIASAGGMGVARFVEQATLVHELGHAIGLVDRGIAPTSPHVDTRNHSHCTNESCVMFFANEGAAAALEFVKKFARTTDAVLFGTECLDDVAKAR